MHDIAAGQRFIAVHDVAELDISGADPVNGRGGQAMRGRNGSRAVTRGVQDDVVSPR
ncbi:MAG TPA: hypothetical protein VE196_11035 [Pseudonocardiaceae bacterium]|nr:hypothetical protein [Pseudonocardiaceae bacterium]